MDGRFKRRVFWAVLAAASVSGLLWLASAVHDRQVKWARWEAALQSLRGREEFLRLDPPSTAPLTDAGAEAIPFLLAQLERHFVERWMDRNRAKLPQVLQGWFRAPDPYVRHAAPEFLRRLGPENATARAALPRMKRILMQDPSNLNLFNAIGHIGREDPATFDLLVSFGTNLAHTSSFRGNAAYYLGFRAPSEKIVSALVQIYQDPDSDVKHYVCQALGRQNPFSRPCIPLLVSSLTNSDSNVRVSALNSLRMIETNQSRLRLLIEPVTRDASKAAAETALHILRQLDEAAAGEIKGKTVAPPESR